MSFGSFFAKLGKYIVSDSMQAGAGRFIRSEIKGKGLKEGVSSIFDGGVKKGVQNIYQNGEKFALGYDYTNIAGKAIKDKGKMTKELYEQAIRNLESQGLDVSTNATKKLIGKEMQTIAKTKGIKLTESVGKEALEKAGKEIVEEGGKKVIKEVGEKTVEKGFKGLLKGFTKKIPLIGCLVTAGFEIPNIYNAFKEGGAKAGWSQVCKSVGSVAGDLGGMAIGATIGSAVFPPIGTFVGGIIGSMVGGSIGGAAGGAAGKLITGTTPEEAKQTQQETSGQQQQGQTQVTFNGNQPGSIYGGGQYQFNNGSTYPGAYGSQQYANTTAEVQKALRSTQQCMDFAKQMNQSYGYNGLG